MLRFGASIRRTLSLSLFALALLAAAAAAATNPRPVVLPARPATSPVVDRVAPVIPDLSGTPASVKLDENLRNLGLSKSAQRLIRQDRGKDVVSVILKGSVSTGALQAMGLEVNSEAGGYRTARVPLSALPAFLKLPGLEKVSLGYQLSPDLDVSVADVNANIKRSNQPPLYGWNGTGVIVGIVDTGMDYQHDDFRNPDGTTRFLSIWDQNASGTPPAAFGYGNECTQAQINAGTCTETDANGHGSHVLGIAAGDGSATGNFEPNFIYVGMANAANIIGVATDFSTAGVVDGVDYIFQRAAALGKPAVVNLSLGTVLGPHDGSTDFDKMLGALTGPGKIIVTSAGNAQPNLDLNNQNAQHASISIPVSTTVTYPLAVPTYTASSFTDVYAVDLWHDKANSYSVKIKRPSSGTLLGPVIKGAVQTFSTTDGRVIVDYTNADDPGDHLSEIYVQVDDGSGTPPKVGVWQVQLTASASEPGNSKVHAWMDGALGDVGLVPYFTANIDTTVNVGSPGTADSVITAAAHNTKLAWASIDGNIYSFQPPIGSPDAGDPPQICPFSARGPRRDGVPKPDISAPGSAIISVLSADSSPPWPQALIVPDGVHLALQGTSMSAPHVTGAVAMLLQKYPTLTPSGAKQLLAGAARSDATTGAVPNPRWGAGRLDVNSLLCSDTQAPTVNISYPQPTTTLYTGTTTGVNWQTQDDTGVQEVKLEYHVGANGPYTLIADHQPDNRNYAWTVPSIAATDSLQIRITGKDCVGSGAGTSAFLKLRAPTVDAQSLPTAFFVHKPSPNPFTGRSALGFDLPSAPAGRWPVAVNVYNVAGRKVRTVVQGSLPAGRYTYEWDGRDDSGLSLSAGIYFLNIKAGPYAETDRLLFLR
ncbi:MAG TPA: S8 family serine peptidase [Candidatus Eisenbacteria bacterium]|jgi:subtilisin family serine protease|nr:S8 family serine peptidase [Candidatus Eisenbacteria bacterium]